MTQAGPAGRPLGFPNCPACPYFAQGASAICITCALSTIPALAGRRCPICAQELTTAGCRNAICAKPPGQRGFTSVAAISVDSAPLNDTIRQFKYGGAYGWGYIFGRLILGWLDHNAATASIYTHIVANPGYINRQPYPHIERILSAATTEDIHHRWPIYPHALVKPIDTTPSAGRDLQAKLAAAREHAAAIRLATPLAAPPMAGATVLIIDDIFTTGAQLDAVGKRFLHSGANRVDGLVLARRPWSARNG